MKITIKLLSFISLIVIPIQTIAQDKNEALIEALKKNTAALTALRKDLLTVGASSPIVLPFIHTFSANADGSEVTTAVTNACNQAGYKHGVLLMSTPVPASVGYPGPAEPGYVLCRN